MHIAFTNWTDYYHSHAGGIKTASPVWCGCDKLKDLLQNDGKQLVPTNAWGRLRFMPNSWASGQDLKNPGVLCDIKFSEREESGRPLLRAYIFADRLDSGAELYKKLEKANPRQVAFLVSAWASLL